MGCFSCCTEDDDDDPSKVELKTAMVVSRFAEEDRRARQEIRGMEAEIDLSKENQEKVGIRSGKPKEKGKRKQEDADDQEDKQLLKTHNETFKDKGPKMYSKDDLKVAVNRSAASISDRGKSVNPQALCCQVCHEPFDVDEIPRNEKYHKDCYKHRFKCYVCEGKIPLNEERKRKYKWHQFWKKNYCPGHDNDGTPKCCSCERLQPQGEPTYVMLEDGRWLCRECMESAYLAWDECQHLQFDMREFFEGLNMKIEKEFPFLLVEKQALNEAEKEEKIDQRNEAVIRGICLSEEQNVETVTKIHNKGPNNKLIRMAKESVRVERKCEVTGILILYGLPRLQTGYILAHEMMHAYLRLNGHWNLNEVLEEGLCQVLGHMWLESQRYATAADATVDASSSSAFSLSRTPVNDASKKGADSEFEKKMVGFCKHQIETDESKVYGDGFRKVNELVTSFSLPETLNIVIRSRKTIPDSKL